MLPVSVTYETYGDPVPQGSTKSFYMKKLGRVVTTHQGEAKLMPYRQALTASLIDAMGDELKDVLYPKEPKVDKKSSYMVEIRFTCTPPQHPACSMKNTKPDLDKLVRAVLDSITGYGFKDDSRVVKIIAEKEFGSPGTKVTLTRIT